MNVPDRDRSAIDSALDDQITGLCHSARSDGLGAPIDAKRVRPLKIYGDAPDAISLTAPKGADAGPMNLIMPPARLKVSTRTRVCVWAGKRGLDAVHF